MSAFFDLGLEAFTKGTIVLNTDTIKVRLGRSSAYTQSQSDQFLTALPATIVTDTTLGTKVLSAGTFDAADITFTAVPAGAAVDRLWIYKDTGSAATSPLIAEITGFSVTPNGGDITIQWQNSTPWIFKI